MRSYGQVVPTFWTRGTGKALRGHPEAQVVALYLMTAPAVNMIGIFPISLPQLCHDTGLTLEGANKGLARCSAEGFAFYDPDDELVWVPGLAQWQVGESLIAEGKNGKPDRRIQGVKRALLQFKGHKFYDQFLERYALAYHLTDLLKEGASKSLPRDSVPVPVPDPVRGGAGGDRRPRDRMAEHLTGNAPTQRADVKRLLALFAESVGLPNLRITTRNTHDAELLAERIDGDGWENCELVARHCPQDRWVKGEADQMGNEHKSVAYVFGNDTAFARILKSAQDAEAKKQPRGKSAIERALEAKAQ